MPELKPCPFCGNKPVVRKYWWFWSNKVFDVECKLCGCEVGNDLDTEEVVINRWNVRAKAAE